MYKPPGRSSARRVCRSESDDVLRREDTSNSPDEGIIRSVMEINASPGGTARPRGPETDG